MTLKKLITDPIYLTILSTLIIMLLLFQFSSGKKYAPAPINVEREFRAAWVATVANINWPSEPGLTVELQKEEAIHILDSLQANNFNAVIFQVRPQADALYQSKIEPWSYYLTGKQGKAPQPLYDPLIFWIDESHKRGLELHAWLNPYRAHHIKGAEVTEHSIVKTRPELVVQLAQGYHWMIPTEQATMDYSLSVVMDIVNRYDVDGIHFDDYFYPYPSYNNGNDFPDDNSYKNYQEDGGDLSRDDWRREAVNVFIKSVYDEIKAEKNHVKFGLSPFGIWRPGYPETIKGMDQYEKLYADAKLWLNEGWVDYFVPQLYWEINQIPQSFPILLNWWEKENILNRHLWPGIRTREAKDEKMMDETINQIMISRAMLSDRPGTVFWNVKALNENPIFSEQLTTGVYKQQALPPVSSWLDKEPPVAPEIEIKQQSTMLEISWKVNADDISQNILYLRYGKIWQYRIFNKEINLKNVPLSEFETVIKKDTSPKIIESKLSEIAVTSVDRVGNESSWHSIAIETD